MKLYKQLAPYWQLISPTSDYESEAKFFIDLLRQYGVKILLELGSGGGNVAYYFKEYFKLTLADVSPDMLEQSKKQNPKCTHIVGSMFNLRLGQTFDAVFLHDASAYITSLKELEQVAKTCAVHCKAGGVLIVAPDAVRENFQSGTNAESHKQGTTILEYKEITKELNDDGITYNYEFEIVITKEGKTKIYTDKQIAGVFSTKQWIGALGDVGFDVKTMSDPFPEHERQIIFVCEK